MSPHSKNYLLIFLFLSTIIAGSIAWQNYSKLADLTANYQILSRELAQSRAMAARVVRQPATIINNADLSAADPALLDGGRNRRAGMGGAGRRNANGGGGGYAGGGG
jgi:uncharacterized membrane protein YgcG